MFYTKLMLLFLVFTIYISDAKSQSVQNKEIPTLTYEELIQNKEQYLGETVRVKAFHISGYEWSFLCNKDCKGRRVETWVKFVSEDELCKKSKKAKWRNELDNKAEVIYIGELSAGGFGHFGIYPYQFTVSCVEKFKLVKPNY